MAPDMKLATDMPGRRETKCWVSQKEQRTPQSLLRTEHLASRVKVRACHAVRNATRQQCFEHADDGTGDGADKEVTEAAQRPGREHEPG